MPVRLRLDQGRALAGARSRDGGLHRSVAREDIVAVHDDAGEAVGRGPVRDVLDRHLLGLLDADRVSVVLTHEDHREPVDPREVHALVPCAGAGRPLAEPAADHGVLAAEFGGVGDPRGVRHLRGDHGGVADDPQTPRAPVTGHLAPARGRIARLREQPEEDLGGGHPCDEHDGRVAVVRDPDVLARPQRPRRAHLAALVAGDRDDERRLALAVQAESRLVDQARRDHRAVHREQVVGGEAEGLVGCVRGHSGRHITLLTHGHSSIGPRGLSGERAFTIPRGKGGPREVSGAAVRAATRAAPRTPARTARRLPASTSSRSRIPTGTRRHQTRADGIPRRAPGLRRTRCH